jgi:hypothetical protein
MAEAKPVPHVDLKVTSDLEQSERHFPLNTGAEALRVQAGEHLSKVPKDVLHRVEATTVAPNDAVRRDTVGAANPFVLASVQSARTNRAHLPSIEVTEEALGHDMATLTDPTKSDVIYPGLHINRDGVIKIVQVAPTLENVTQWVDDGNFFTDAVQFTDPIQGNLADCYFIAALASVAWACPLLVSQRPAPKGQAGHFADSTAADAISFFDSSGRHDVSATELLPQLNGSWIYAHADDRKELWPGVYEKAFAMWKTKTTSEQPNLSKIAYGDTIAAGVSLTNGSGSYFPTSEVINLPFLDISFDLVTADQIWQTVRAHSLGMRTFHPMMAWTPGSAPAGLDYGSAQVVLNHAYSILGWDYRNGTEYIVLRNPWGTYEAMLNVLAGSWSAYDVSFWRATTLSSAGVFAMSAPTFKQYFQGFGVVVPPAGADVQ